MSTNNNNKKKKKDKTTYPHQCNEAKLRQRPPPTYLLTATITPLKKNNKDALVTIFPFSPFTRYN